MSAVLRGAADSRLEGAAAPAARAPAVGLAVEALAPIVTAADVDTAAANAAAAWLEQLPHWAPELQRAAVWLIASDGALHLLAAFPSPDQAAQVTPMPLSLAAPGAPPDQGAGHAGQAAQPAGPPNATIVRHDGIARIDFPVCSDERGSTLVSLALADLPSLNPQRLIRQLHWGAGWLLRAGDGHSNRAQQARLDRARFVIDAGAAMLDRATPHESALALVNLMALRFNATLVQLGRVHNLATRTVARCNAAWFDARTHLVHLAEAAMNEAIDERALIVWPPREGDPPAAAAVADYAHEEKAGGLAIVPLMQDGSVEAVLLFERDLPFTEAETEAMEVAAVSITPIFALQWQAAESLPARLRRSLLQAAAFTTDSSRPGLKLAAVAGAVALVAALLIPVTQRVTAHSIIEGEVQRAAVAPFAGYVQTALARAGDTVKIGQVLATLDDKDLRLDRQRLESELEVSLRKEREAIAAGNRVETRLASAQAGQTRAQLDLVLEKLQRLQIAAPYAGVIVKGDLSQQIGSPVEQGKLLFEIAPLDAWRVVLEVDERDMALLQLGQPGQIVLTSLPGQRFDFTVRRITAVSTPQEGRNFFRVEAQVAQPDPRLRPGLEGVAKVQVGEGGALGVWTRNFRHWLRIAIWEHLP